MSTPRSIQLQQDILLGVIENGFLKIVGNHYKDRIFLRFGDRLTLHRSGYFISAKLVDKLGNCCCVDSLGLRQGIFELLLNILNCKGRPFRLCQVERFGVVGKLDMSGERMSVFPM